MVFAASRILKRFSACRLKPEKPPPAHIPIGIDRGDELTTEENQVKGAKSLTALKEVFFK